MAPPLVSCRRSSRSPVALLTAAIALAACSTPNAPQRLREESLRADQGEPVLLSAGLLRERGATSDRADPDAEHARLIAHFDRVIEILTAQSAASLDRAVARLGDPAARERLALRRG